MKADAQSIKRLVALKDKLDAVDHEVIDDVVRGVDDLNERVRLLLFRLGQFFRRKSEKVSEDQLPFAFIAHLVNEAVQGGEQSDAEDDSQDGVEAPAVGGNVDMDAKGDATELEEKPRRRRKRKSAIELLPVKIEDVYPADEERRCSKHGDSMVEIHCKVRRQIIFVPAKAFVLEEHIHIYECAPCGYDNPISGKARPKLIEEGLASSSLLSHLIVSKVIDGIPLERVGRQLERHGVSLATARLYDWFARVADEVDAIWRHARDDLLSSTLISLDDTPYTFKAGKGDGAKRGRVWVYLGDVNRVAYCEFTENWQGVHPRKLLDSFCGVVQNDGYGGITPLFGRPGGPIRLGCHDHARRKVVAALQAGDERAGPLLVLYRKLYRIERLARDNGLDPHGRLELRRSAAAPVWRELCDKVDMLRMSVGNKTILGRALTYLTNQREYLSLYLTDGSLPIANAHVEGLIRVVAVARKASLYFGNALAGRRYSRLLTLGLNCLLSGANPYDYFRDVIDLIADGFRARDVAQLMPQRWVLDHALQSQPSH